MPILLTPDIISGIVIRLATSVFGTFGFAIMLGVPAKKLTLATLGGLLTCAAYEIAALFGGSPLVSAFAASVFMTLYSEALARKLRTPVLVFFIPCAIPIVPGSGLYYTIYNMLFYDQDKLFYYGSRTLGTALGIAIGFAVATTLVNGIVSFIRYREAKKRNA